MYTELNEMKRKTEEKKKVIKTECIYMSMREAQQYTSCARPSFNCETATLLSKTRFALQLRVKTKPVKNFKAKRI